MVNRPRAIGTAGESAVVNYLLACGLKARREVLHGREDHGDVHIELPDGRLAIIEVKSGKAAESASYNQVVEWMREVMTEQRNAKADYGFLVRKRKATGTMNTGQWHLHWWFDGALGINLPVEGRLANLPLLIGMTQ